MVRVLFEHCRLINDVAEKALVVARKRHRQRVRREQGLTIAEQQPTLSVDGWTGTINSEQPPRDDDGEAYQDLQRIWNEIAKIRSIDFNQTSPGSAYSAAPNIAQAIMRFGLEDCLSAGSILQNVEEEDVNTNNESTSIESTDLSHDAFLRLLEHLVNFTNRLTPENCMVERCSATAWKEEVERYGDGVGEGIKQDTRGAGDSGNVGQGDDKGETTELFGLRKEKWYGVEYYLSPIDPICVEGWKREGAGEIIRTSSSTSFIKLEDDSSGMTTSILRLPSPNRYLPRTLELCPDLPEEAKLGPRIDKDVDPPELLLDGAHGTSNGEFQQLS